MFRIEFEGLDIGGRYATGWVEHEGRLEWYGDIYDCDFMVDGKPSTEDDAIDLVAILNVTDMDGCAVVLMEYPNED